MSIALTIVFCLLSILSFIEILKVKEKYNKTLFFLSYIVLSLTAGLRYGDRDYFAYINAYNHAPNWDVGESFMEVGYRYAGYFFKILGFSAEQFLFIFAFLSVGLIFIFIKRYTPFVFTAVFIFFCHTFILRDMLQIRSSLSIGIAMLAIPYIENRKFVKTLSVIIFAGLFHFVGYFFIVLYFLYPFFSKKRIAIFIITGVILGIILTQDIYYKILDLTNFQKLYLYLVDTQYNYSLGLLNPVLIKTMLFLIIFLFSYDILIKVPHFKILLSSYAIACFILSAFSNFAILAGRIGTLFSNVELVLLPFLLYLPRIKRHRGLFFVVIICYCAVMFFYKWQDLTIIKFVFQ
jgi:hypothetical protein